MHFSTKGPDYGSCDTRSVCGGDQEQEISRDISYTPGQYEKDSPPEFAIGFDLLETNTARENNLVFEATIIDNYPTFKAAVWTGDGSKLRRARMTWVVRKKTAKKTQFGTHRFGHMTSKDRYLEQTINFETPFDEKPYVILWLKDFNSNGGQDAWKVGLYDLRTTKTSFLLRAECWADGSFTSLTASWIAIGGGDRVFDFGSSGRPSTIGQKQTQRSKYVKFITTFSKPPTIITGFSHIEIPTSKPGRLESVVKDVTKDGFTWELEHDSENINIAAYIAIPSEG